MNNIYKVIWSKAKNCYVVASEIARSHTKSATGSKKIGGVTRRSLLASLMALSLLCGGLGVASAADVVHVDESATGTHEVYTKAKVDTLLNDKADATALDGKANTSLDNLSDAGKSVIKDTMAGELAKKADATAVTALEGRVGGVEGKVTALETTVGDASSGLVKDVNDLNTAIGTKANQSDLVAATNRISTNEGNISALQKKTTNISYADGAGTSIDGITVKDGNIVGNGNSAITGITNIATDNINGKSLAGTTVATLKEVTDEVGTEKTERENADKALSDRIGNLTEDKNYIKKDKNVSDNLVELDKQAKTNADAIAQEKTDREKAIGSLTEDKNYIKKDKNVSDNLVELDKQAKANADAITETNQRTHGITRDDSRNETSIEGRVTVDTNGNIKAEGTITSNGLNAGSGEITTTGKVSAGDVSTGTLETTGDATIGRDLTVKGILNTKDVKAETIHVSKSEDTPDHTSKGSIIGEGGHLSVSNEKTDKRTNITEKSELNVNEKGTVNWATSTDNETGNVTGGRSEVAADHIKNSVMKTEGGKTFGYDENITADGKVGTATDKDGNKNELTQTATGTENTVTSKDGNKSTTKQEAGSISSTVYDKDGNVKASSEMKEDGSISNNATGDMTNTVGGDLKTTVAGNELHEVTGTKTENVTGKVTENYKAGQETNVTGDQDIYVTGKQTNKIDGDQENTIGGSQTTTVTGDISNKAENITNEANTKLTDKVGDHTRVLDSEGITDTVGGSTFKQRIDKIMMESKDVSIKAEGTLTNEAKVITNKASEVINNEAVNINNTATGIITSKASEIKNQADKLISNKVGENTWENMEDGKITTSIKDGAKQNLTQSDAAGTTQSTVDDGKSTVTIQNADGLVDVVTDETNTSVQNQTASQIATDVKDRAGNENASVANATISANTIKSGSKTNTVISTADGTSFINSEAAAPVTGASGAGTAVNTTIKGNTITTGKVTMDYAEVMKDLGVHGNAKIDGKTTTDSLEVTGTSTLKGNVTMESDATVKKNLTVNGITTTKTLKVTENAEIDGNAIIKGDVTARSYKVGGNTYIDANGIHANNQKITDVADGSISEGSKDAVNGGQLYGVKRDLEHQVDKVGANAAAMANLRPMEFDPSSKWNIAAAIGNYGSETAAALGAFYRPNDDVMVNLSTAFGTGENMVGGGVSVRLGKSGNKLSREENNALKAQVDDLTARMDALLSVLNPNMSKDFPDVPENHWAYEAVSRLAGNDIVQGYPDGEFHGERTMTRYEMAEIIYNALSRGAEAEKELVEEFKPELQAMAASEKATAEKAEG